MEQRAAGERQRGGSLNPRGNAGGGSRITSGATTYQPPAEAAADHGRHRSPWGRPGRILPVRWGRVVAGCVAVVAVAAGIVGVTMAVSRAGGARPAAASDGRADDTSRVAVGGAPAAPGAVAPGSTSGSASPAPGTTEVTSSLAAVPPAPSEAAPTALRVDTTPGPRGPALTVSATKVDLGSVDSTDTVSLTDVGTQALTLRVGSLPSWLTAVPRAATLDPGYQTELVITLDRAAAPVGQVNVQVPVAPVSGSGGGTIQVTALVAAGPRIQAVTAPALRAQGCTAAATPAASPAPTSGALSVEVRDAVGMAGGTVAVTNPDGTTAVMTLTLATSSDDESTWTAPLGPTGAGTLAYTVTVKDLNSRTASQQGSVVVGACS